MLVVLLALADGRLGEGDAHHGRPFKTAGDGGVEGVHVLGEEPLADDPQGLNLLLAAGYQLGPADGGGRLVLQREASVFGAYGGGTFGDGRKEDRRAMRYAIKLLALEGTYRRDV